jgi:hypothetical protein
VTVPSAGERSIGFKSRLPCNSVNGSRENHPAMDSRKNLLHSNTVRSRHPKVEQATNSDPLRTGHLLVTQASIIRLWLRACQAIPRASN